MAVASFKWRFRQLFDPTPEGVTERESAAVAKAGEIEAENRRLRQELDEANVRVRVLEDDAEVHRQERLSLVAVIERDRLRVQAETAGFAAKASKLAPPTAGE